MTKHIIRMLCPCAIIAAAVAARAGETAGEVVRAGAGGYLSVRPKTCRPLPAEIYRTPALKGPVPTNQWWSSLVWLPFSQPLYAHPPAVTCTPEGLNVSFPGARLRADRSAIFAFVGPKDADLVLSHSADPTFARADLDGVSDWFISVSMRSGGAAMRASFGHGSPYIYCIYEGGSARIKFRGKPTVWAGRASDAVLGVSIGGRHYGLFAPTGSTWTGLEGTVFTSQPGGKPYFSLAVLPDDDPRTLELFRRYAHQHVADTRAQWSFQRPGVVRCTWNYTFKPYEPGPQGTLFALYPHQWKYTTSKLTDKTYPSVRGLMKLGEGASFTTVVPVQGVLPRLPEQGVQDRARIAAYLKKEADRKPPPFGDTYWEGKHLGRLANLSGVAEAAGEKQLQDVFIAEIKRRLENWFSAEPGKQRAVFYYDAAWGTLIGSPPSYGSDNPLNDHHFHYGYFIRAAAEVARVDRAWAEKWAPMVRLLIRDIASADRNDPMFPYLRCFDLYAGHSWASGNANFVDGNNQESSSESLNAWYGLMLWGQAAGDHAARDLGVFLFNTERTAVEEYWFDVSGTNFPKDFPHVALGMVWGGKGAFGTWFSGDIDCIHGINWLPFTPASIYMGRFPEYVKKNHDRVVAQRKGGANYNSGWGDLLVMFYALADPAAAARYIDANPDCRLEGGNCHAFMYHWIYTLNNLGINDAAVTADYPFFNVYARSGRRAYAAYNFDDTPLTVTFSDGVRLSGERRGLMMRQAER